MEPNPNPSDAAVLEDQMARARRLARRLIADADRAEDVAQDAVVVAWKRQSPAGWTSASWIAGIVRNVARQSERSERRRRRRERLAARAALLAPGDLVAERLAEHRRLVDAVLRLPEDYRIAVWLRWFEDQPPREIAKRLGVSVETVRTRCKRGVDLLRREMDRGTDADRDRWRLAFAPLPATGWWWFAPWLGGIAVGTKTKAAAVGALLLLAVGATWFAVSEGTGRPPDEAPDLATASVPDAPPAGTLEGRADAEVPRSSVTTTEIRVTGRVVDGAGDPVPGAEIRVGSASVPGVGERSLAARASSDGSFGVHLPAGGAAVSASSPGFRSAQRRIEKSEANVLLRLARTKAWWFRVLDRETDLPLADVLCETFHTSGGAEVRTATRTDADGLAVVECPSELDAASTQFSLPGYAPRFGIDAVGLGNAGTKDAPRQVYLARGRRLEVQVVDGRGDAVEGATVEAWSGSGRTLEERGRVVLSDLSFAFGSGGCLGLGRSLTDARGSASLDPPADNLPSFVRARKEGAFGLAVLRNRGAWSPTAPSVRVTLLPTVEISGVVLDARGAPVAGALVVYGIHPLLDAKYQTESIPIPPRVLTERTETRTDARGRFRLPEVPTGFPDRKVWITAHHAALGHASQHVDVSAEKSVEDVQLEFPAEDAIRVRVRDEEGRPVEGAWVSYPSMMPRARSDAEGLATRRRVLKPPSPLEVIAEGYLSWKGDSPEGDTVLEVVLSRAHEVRGRIVDAEGRATAGHVCVFVPSVEDVEKPTSLPADDPRRLGHASAGSDGTFGVEELPAGPWFVVAWRVDRTQNGNSMSSDGRIVSEGEEARLVLPVPPPLVGRTVEGRVEDSTGQPVTEYHAWVRSGQAVLVGRRFRFEGVPHGPTELHVSTWNGSHKTDVPIVVPEDRDLLDLVVRLEETLTFVGRLEAEGPADLSRLLVEAIPSAKGGGGSSGVTDAAGGFRLRRLPAGEYRLVAGASRDRAEAWEIVEPAFRIGRSDETPRVVRVRPAGRLALRLEAEGFAESSDVAFSPANRWKPESERSFASVIAVSGPEERTFSTQGLYRGTHPQSWALAPGTWTLRVTTKDRGSFETSFVVRAHETTEVLVDLRP